MKNDDWMVEKVMTEILQELGSKMGQIAYNRDGASTSGVSIYGNDIDTLKYKGELPDEEPNKHDDDPNAEETPCDLDISDRLQEAAKKKLVVTWDTLPQPSVTELQWAEPESAERKELEAFLNKIGGKGLADKLQKIQAVVDEGFPKKTAMSTVLSYLVFLKTLTYIITSFNSASAGFTFESFLGVLLGGQQIPAGGDTIADYVDAAGEYVSLKLLGVKGSEGTASASTIDGSFTQLIDDLSGVNEKGTGIDSGGKMKYVIALKDLQGKGDKLGGTISVYEFVFRRSTLAKLMNLTPKSRNAFRLIAPEHRDRWNEEDYKEEFEDFLHRHFAADSIDGQIHPELISRIAHDVLTKKSGNPVVLNDLQSILAKLGLEELSANVVKNYNNEEGVTKDEALLNAKEVIESSKDFRTALANYIGQAAQSTYMASDAVKNWKQLPAKKRENPKTKKPAPEAGQWSRGRELDPVDKKIKNAVNSLWAQETKGLPTRANSTDTKKAEFAADQDPKKGANKMIMSFDDSVAELATIKSDKEYYQHIKDYSMGYNSKGEPQFQIAQKDVINQGKGKFSTEIGKLTVGREAVERAIEKSVTDINEKMFEAFNKMNDLSKSLQDFFLKGLRSAEGEKAIGATRGIAKDTSDLMKQKQKNK